MDQLSERHYRIAIVGAGFSGIGLAIQIRRAGIDDFVILERSAGVGGVWRANTYPGCQCDVPSHLYSFSFAPKHDWSRYFAPQAEIWAYLEDCTNRFGVRPHLRSHTTVHEARWDDVEQLWRVETSAGSITADVLVAAVGGLSEPSVPSIPGLERFEGVMFHSADWRHDHDLTGEAVAVVGTGASAIQFVPEIQPVVGRLTIFQRTPSWVVPRFDAPIGRRARERYRRHPWLQRLVRRAIYWSRELLVPGFARTGGPLRVTALLARRHLRRQVPDERLRAMLTPEYSVGCKRILLSDTWYPAIQQPNVEVVSTPIAEVRSRSIVTTDGAEYLADTIVLGTGFRVTTHPAFDVIRDGGGRSLGEVWREAGMAAYKGTAVAGFPNLFIMTGPNTGLGHTSMIFMMESQFAYVVDAVRRLESAAADPLPEAQRAYNDRLQAALAKTVWNTGGCASWYLDAHGRNTTLWPGYTWQFRLATRRFDIANYRVVPRRGSPVT
jgi:cation diffusion facilitator CzcD-associated flavoprotein CzcO